MNTNDKELLDFVHIDVHLIKKLFRQIVLARVVLMQHTFYVSIFVKKKNKKTLLLLLDINLHSAHYFCICCHMTRDV